MLPSVSGWPPSARPPYDRIPPGWLAVGDAIERTGRLILGPEWTGAETRALSDEEILAALDDEEELAAARRRRLKSIREAERGRRAQSATAARDVIPEEEKARRAQALTAAAPLIERLRKADRRVLRLSKTSEGRRRAREWQKQLDRDFLHQELTEANAPLRQRWEEARSRLETEVTVGRIEAAVWLTPSKRLRRLTASECRVTFPAPREKGLVKFEGEPGWFVVWQDDIDSAFAAPPPSSKPTGQKDISDTIGGPPPSPEPERLPVKQRHIKNRAALEEEIGKLVADGHKSGARALFQTLGGRYTRQEIRDACHKLFPGRRAGRPLVNAPEKNRPAQ